MSTGLEGAAVSARRLTVAGVSISLLAALVGVRGPVCVERVLCLRFGRVPGGA
jgi:hypothetical protein